MDVTEKTALLPEQKLQNGNTGRVPHRFGPSGDLFLFGHHVSVVTLGLRSFRQSCRDYLFAKLRTICKNATPTPKNYHWSYNSLSHKASQNHPIVSFHRNNALGHLHIQIPISPFITPPSCHHHFQTRVPLKTASTSPSSAAKTIPNSQIHFLSFLTQHAPFFTHRFWENSLYSQVNLPIGDNRTGNDVLLAAAPTPIPIDNPKIFT